MSEDSINSKDSNKNIDGLLSEDFQMKKTMKINSRSNSSVGNENNSDDKKRNEVRKEFTLEFKKNCRIIPPKIKFKGNVSKRSLISKKMFKAKYGGSNIILFKKYIVLTVESVLHFYTKIFKLIFSKKLKNFEKIMKKY